MLEVIFCFDYTTTTTKNKIDLEFVLLYHSNNHTNKQTNKTQPISATSKLKHTKT